MSYKKKKGVFLVNDWNKRVYVVIKCECIKN